MDPLTSIMCCRQEGAGSPASPSFPLVPCSWSNLVACRSTRYSDNSPTPKSDTRDSAGDKDEDKDKEKEKESSKVRRKSSRDWFTMIIFWIQEGGLEGGGVSSGLGYMVEARDDFHFARKLEQCLLGFCTPMVVRGLYRKKSVSVIFFGTPRFRERT